MAFSAEVLKDSMSPREDRLTTFELTFPRFILAQYNTHAFSRNTASSRAIPSIRQISSVLSDPYIPMHWGINQPGMAATEAATTDESEVAEKIWLTGRDHAVITAYAALGGEQNILATAKNEEQTVAYGGLVAQIKHLVEEYKDTTPIMPRALHKQVANRGLEPWLWQTVISTMNGSVLENFYALRDHEDAQPEIQHLAQIMYAAQTGSTPEPVRYKEYHIPMLREADMDLPIEVQIKAAIGRLARVSYLTHNNVRDVSEDIRLHDGLLSDGHMSPFEHVARPFKKKAEKKALLARKAGKFEGWQQYRKTLKDEDNFANVRRRNEPDYVLYI